MDLNSPFDFSSETFDPVLTLQSNSIVLPYPKAKTYNNIAEYYSRTFLKGNLGISKKNILTPKDRNYSYYLDTIGLTGYRAVRYLQDMERRHRAKKSLKKKPKNLTYTPGSPLRSGKITNLESKFSDYWKRKQRLFKSEKDVPDIANILKKSENIPLFQKIKSLAKPLTAQELITKAKQQASASSHASEVFSTFPVDKQHICDPSKFGPSTSATSTDYLSDDSSGTEELQRFCRNLSFRIRKNPVDKQISQSQTFLGVTNPGQCDQMSKGFNSGLNDLQTDCISSSKKKQIDSPLTPTENIIKSSKRVKSSDSGSKKKVKVIKQTPKKVQPSKITLKKENCELLLKQCTCNHPKVSMGSHCSCGVYATAMNNVLKFKIPRKKKN